MTPSDRFCPSSYAIFCSTLSLQKRLSHSSHVCVLREGRKGGREEEGEGRGRSGGGGGGVEGWGVAFFGDALAALPVFIPAILDAFRLSTALF